jgi:hypothetical protein
LTPEFTYRGFWWTPDQPTKKMVGELEIDSSGTLVLFVVDDQTYFQFFETAKKKNNKIPIINGYARNSRTKKDLAFTLFDNSIFSYNVSGLAEFKIQSRYATSLKHYKSVDSLKLSSVFIEFKLLDEWIRVSGFKGVKQRTKIKFKIIVGYEQPKPITLLKTKDFHLYLWFRANTHSSAKDFKISETPFINLEFKKQVTYEEFKKHYELVKNFFSFCISLPITSKQIEFQEFTTRQLKKEKVEHQNTFGLFISDTRTYTKRESMQSSVMLIDYDKIKGNELNFVQSWFKLNAKIEPVLKLYFDTLYNPDLYKENVFLNYVAALEIYHRISYPNFDGKDEAYFVKLDAILKTIKAQNDRNWISTRMRKRKETNLLSRIINIVQRTPEISKRLAGDTIEFSNLVANTRHYFTHFDQKNRKNGIAEGDDLFDLMYKAKIYLQIQILLDLGFAEKEVDVMIKKAMSNWYIWNR